MRLAPVSNSRPPSTYLKKSMKTAIVFALVGGMSVFLAAPKAARAQSANQWYPTANPGFVVKDVWYLPVTHQAGIPPHIGVSTMAGGSYFYYFTRTDANSSAQANTIWATLLAAAISGQPVFIYVSGADSIVNPGGAAGGVWDFSAVQIGNN